MSVALMASYDSLYPESECEVVPNLHGYITGISQRADKVLLSFSLFLRPQEVFECQFCYDRIMSCTQDTS